MADKIPNPNDTLSKKDLEIILEVNKKALAIEAEVAGQNEEIIVFLEDSKKKNEDLHKKIEELQKELQKRIEELQKKSDTIIDNTVNIDKDLFKIQILFITGVLGFVVQIIQFFMKK